MAFQTPTDDDQATMRRLVSSQGLPPAQQIDRHWFRSVYFREVNGILFELATNGPGYTSDEPVEELGGQLVLPGELEARREQIEAGLADVEIPRPKAVEVGD